MKSIDDYSNDFEKNPKGTAKKAIIWIISICLLIGAAFWVGDLLLTPVQTAKAVIQKTLDPDNVLQNYEWFKQQYNDYLAINEKVIEADSAVVRFKKDLPNDRTKWGFDDKQEYARLQSIYNGLQFQRNDIVSAYNAKSKMMNRDIFKTKDLPDQLPIN